MSREKDLSKILYDMTICQLYKIRPQHISIRLFVKTKDPTIERRHVDDNGRRVSGITEEGEKTHDLRSDVRPYFSSIDRRVSGITEEGEKTHDLRSDVRPYFSSIDRRVSGITEEGEKTHDLRSDVRPYFSSIDRRVSGIRGGRKDTRSQV